MYAGCGLPVGLQGAYGMQRRRRGVLLWWIAMDRGRCLAMDCTGACRATRRDRGRIGLRRRIRVGDQMLLVTIGVALRRIHVCLRTRWSWVLEYLMHRGMGAGRCPRDDRNLLVRWCS